MRRAISNGSDSIPRRLYGADDRADRRFDPAAGPERERRIAFVVEEEHVPLLSSRRLTPRQQQQSSDRSLRRFHPCLLLRSPLSNSDYWRAVQSVGAAAVAAFAGVRDATADAAAAAAAVDLLRLRSQPAAPDGSACARRQPRSAAAG